MAAYVALTSLSETTERLLQKIILQKTTDHNDEVDLTSSRNKLLQQLENEIQSLRENTDFLLFVLEKSPTHPFEAQMKDAADHAQVIIERFVLDKLRPESTLDDDDDDVILESLSHQLQRIRADLIAPMVHKIKNSTSQTDEESVVGIFDSRSEIQLTSADIAVVTNEMVERLEHLLFDKSCAELRVVSIVGMGGIGKTTLASWYYGYALFHPQRFEIIGCVMGSRDFSARDILVSLVASIKPFIAKPKQMNESIENYVHSNLKGRRFFIVLDNVWSPEALRVFMRAIPDDGNRSVILITTRHEEVAVEANPNKPTHTVTMRLRTPDESHDLLQRKVFGDDGSPPDEVRDLLPSIAMVCDGLPLALALVAGILRASNQSMHEYKYVLEELSVGYNSRHEMVDAILALSYIHLPHRLRSCLLYMGAFPEDRHQIYVGRLTKQLSAQCFMRKSTSPDVEQCLHDLVDRNLVLLLASKPDCSAKSVRIMNDMVRDFCLKKAREEKFLHCVKDDEPPTTSKIKVSFNLDNLKRICNNSDDADYDTHTIICFGRGRWTRSRSLISVGRFRLLKSLDLENVEIESFPNEVLNLSLLRLLALGHVPELPQSISNLRYLETMIVNDAKDASSSSSSMITLPRILCVPSEIWTMSRLRHIVSFCCGALASPNKQESSPLENLETLSAVMNLDCSEDLIEMIPNVKKLGIFYFGVERGTHSIENIERLSRLEKLKVWVMVPFSAPQNLNLGFPATLRRLTLRGLRLSHRDMLVIGRLPRLQALKLIQSDFEGGEWRVTATCGLEKLEFLMVAESGLRRWLCDNGGGGGFVFPMLHTLVIRACKELNEIEHVVRNIPSSLEVIIIWSCNKSLVESAKRISQSNENIRVFIR